MNEILFRAKISLRSLNRCVSEEQLDLFQFPTRGAAQLRACAAKIVGRDSGDASGGGVRPKELPNHLLA